MVLLGTADVDVGVADTGLGHRFWIISRRVSKGEDEQEVAAHDIADGRNTEHAQTPVVCSQISDTARSLPEESFTFEISQRVTIALFKGDGYA